MREENDCYEISMDHSLQEGLVGGEKFFDFVPEIYLQC